MWRDIDTIRLNSREWELVQHEMQEDDNAFLSSVNLETVSGSGGSRGYKETIQVGVSDDIGKIIISLQENKGIGCRLLAKGLYQLALRSGGIERLPSKIFCQAKVGHFAPRGLLTLLVLSHPQTRQKMMGGYAWHLLPSESGEKPKMYEARATELMFTHFPGYEKLMPGNLCLPDVASSPDGLFSNKSEGQLIIVKAKRHNRDFADGAAQLLQYYGQAMFHQAFRDLKVKTLLVTSEAIQKDGYSFWESLMASKKHLTFVVDYT